LKQALAVKLEESPFLNMVPEQRVRETLGMMKRPAGERLTPAVAQEGCQRQNAKATVGGPIAPLGNHYIIALEATNCATGESLAREQLEAAGQDQVLPVLGKAATSLRQKLGESIASIQKADTPIGEATTTSLDALRAFSLANARRAAGALTEAVPLYEHAIELDPNFAMAYARAASVYATVGEMDKSIQARKKAFELREHTTQREKLVIAATYYHYVTGEIDRALTEYEVWEQMYPRDLE